MPEILSVYLDDGDTVTEIHVDLDGVVLKLRKMLRCEILARPEFSRIQEVPALHHW